MLTVDGEYDEGKKYGKQEKESCHLFVFSLDVQNPNGDLEDYNQDHRDVSSPLKCLQTHQVRPPERE